MKPGILVTILLVLVFLALVANVVVVAQTGKSPITESIVKGLAFWALAVANFCMAGAGMYFTTRAHQKHEKSSIEWGRRGFVVNFVVTLVLTLAPWFFYETTKEFTRVDAMFDVSLILLLFGISGGTFLYAFYREYLRNVGNRPGGSRGARRTPMLESAERERLP